MSKIEIKNYRSLCNVTIYPKDILALVGRNNSGKSNVLKALQVFFESKPALIDEECFHYHLSEIPIEIFVTFEQLSDWETEQFEPWMNDDKLTIGRIIKCDTSGSIKIENIAVTKVPEFEWLN